MTQYYTFHISYFYATYCHFIPVLHYLLHEIAGVVSGLYKACVHDTFFFFSFSFYNVVVSFILFNYGKVLEAGMLY